jgi:hypothetical protein
VLTRSRIAALSALGLVITAAAGTAAPAASAPAAAAASASATVSASTTVSASAVSAAAVGAPHFPAGATTKLIRELQQAWQITRGQGVTIAVLSTAVDPVTGLAGKLIQGPDYAPLPGASAVDGTILASLIAGSGPTGTNPIGTIGRAPGAKILAEQVGDYNSRGGGKYLADGTWQRIMARAIRYAVNHGAGVIVTFYGDSDDTPVLDSAVQYAISKNVIVLGSATALTGKPTPYAYPDSLPGVINFTGVTISGLPKPPQRDYVPANNSVLIAAPDNVLAATGPGNAPYTAWGYYSDIAWVAGTVALIKAVYPQVTPAQVARALAASASYHPPGGYNTTVGFGLINPIGALHDAAALVRLGTNAPSGPATVSATARFGTAQPAVIDAVHHAKARLLGYSAAIVVGLVLLALALILGRRGRRGRRRRRQRADGPASPEPPPASLPSLGLPADSPTLGLPADSPTLGLRADSPTLGLRADLPPFEPPG